MGVYKFEPLHNRYCVMNYGGELYVASADRADGDVHGAEVGPRGRRGGRTRTSSVVFSRPALPRPDPRRLGLVLNPNSGRLFCNIPEGGGRYGQLIRNMAKPAWQEWKFIPARCWGWIDPYVYHADDKGNVYEMHPSHQSDDGLPIYVDVQTAWFAVQDPRRSSTSR